METSVSRLANNPNSISGPNKGTPAKANSAFNDMSFMSFAPTSASPADNVLGLSPAGSPALSQVPGAAPAVPAVDSVELGSEEWQQIKLNSAVERLRREYALLAARNGGTLQDPYWANEYERALQEEAQAISAEASNYRQTAEENQKNRSSQEGISAADRASAERLAAERIAAEERNAEREERAAMVQGLGGLGLSALTTPYGGTESSFRFVKDASMPGGGYYEPVAGTRPSTLLGRGVNAIGNSFRDQSTPASFSPLTGSPSAAPVGPTRPGMDLLASPSYDNLVAQRPGSTDRLTGVRSPGDPGVEVTPGSSGPRWGSSFFAPSLLGSGAGALLGGGKKGAWSSLASGMLGSAATNALASGSSPWANLITSGGMAYANPLSKKSWGKNTLGTIGKMAATIGAGALTRRFL